MRTTNILPSIVTVLSEVLKDSSSFTRVWALHSLSLTIEAAGPAYSSLVTPTLSTLYSLMLNEENPSVEEFRCFGRVVHGIMMYALGLQCVYIVSALGPELKVNSSTMRKCTAVAIELRVALFQMSR